MEVNKHRACGKCCIKVSGINVFYGKEQILKDINIHIHCGQLTVIIGPNGAGKSTLLKALIGEIPHKGNIVFTDLHNNTTKKLTMGYVPQKLDIERDLPVTVYDMFASYISEFPVWVKKKKKTYEYIKNQLKIFSIEDCIDKQIGKLSGGQLQRVLLAVAVTPVPNLLILDEPVSGIDRNGIRDFYNIVNEMKNTYDMAVILVSHDLELTKKYADKVMLINREVLCQGTVDEVYSDEKFKKIFEIND